MIDLENKAKKIETNTVTKMIKSNKDRTLNKADSSPSVSLINTNLALNVSFNGPQIAKFIVAMAVETINHTSISTLTPKYFAVRIRVIIENAILTKRKSSKKADIFIEFIFLFLIQILKQLLQLNCFLELYSNLTV